MMQRRVPTSERKVARSVRVSARALKVLEAIVRSFAQEGISPQREATNSGPPPADRRITSSWLGAIL